MSKPEKDFPATGTTKHKLVKPDQAKFDAEVAKLEAEAAAMDARVDELEAQIAARTAATATTRVSTIT